jgi:hypothetical protein
MGLLRRSLIVVAPSALGVPIVEFLIDITTLVSCPAEPKLFPFFCLGRTSILANNLFSRLGELSPY